MEPGFYKCGACGTKWRRNEHKFHTERNAPPKCPECGAGADKQGNDDEAEQQYTHRVYGGFVKTLEHVIEKETKKEP